MHHCFLFQVVSDHVHVLPSGLQDHGTADQWREEGGEMDWGEWSTFQARAENTFLLALDGDVDFQPEAVIRLVDMMKKNKGVGAACGRIHPTGSGYMPAYQTFEYAVSNLLVSRAQLWFCTLLGGSLASESHRTHLGMCVVQVDFQSSSQSYSSSLPNQPWMFFSLPWTSNHGRQCHAKIYKGKRGLKVVAQPLSRFQSSLSSMYSTTRARTGRILRPQRKKENGRMTFARWLCTLMLQQGWRVEYSAASDSYTGHFYALYTWLLGLYPLQKSHRHNKTWATNPIYPTQYIAAHF